MQIYAYLLLVKGLLPPSENSIAVNNNNNNNNNNNRRRIENFKGPHSAPKSALKG